MVIVNNLLLNYPGIMTTGGVCGYERIFDLELLWESSKGPFVVLRLIVVAFLLVWLPWLSSFRSQRTISKRCVCCYMWQRALLFTLRVLLFVGAIVLNTPTRSRQWLVGANRSSRFAGVGNLCLFFDSVVMACWLGRGTDIADQFCSSWGIRRRFCYWPVASRRYYCLGRFRLMASIVLIGLAFCGHIVKSAECGYGWKLITMIDRLD